MKFYEKFTKFLSKMNLSNQQYQAILDIYQGIPEENLSYLEEFIDKQEEKEEYNYFKLMQKLSLLLTEDETIDIEDDLEDEIIDVEDYEEVEDEEIKHSKLFEQITGFSSPLSDYYHGDLSDEDRKNNVLDNYSRLYSSMVDLEFEMQDTDYLFEALTDAREFLENNIDLDSSKKIDSLYNKVEEIKAKYLENYVKEELEEKEETKVNEEDTTIEMMDLEEDYEEQEEKVSLKDRIVNAFRKNPEDDYEELEDDLEEVEEERISLKDRIVNAFRKNPEDDYEELEDDLEEVEEERISLKDRIIGAFRKNPEDYYEELEDDLKEEPTEIKKVELDDEIDIVDVPERISLKDKIKKLFTKKEKVVENVKEKTETTELKEVELDDEIDIVDVPERISLKDKIKKLFTKKEKVVENVKEKTETTELKEVELEDEIDIVDVPERVSLKDRIKALFTKKEKVVENVKEETETTELKEEISEVKEIELDDEINIVDVPERISLKDRIKSIFTKKEKVVEETEEPTEVKEVELDDEINIVDVPERISLKDRIKSIFTKKEKVVENTKEETVEKEEVEVIDTFEENIKLINKFIKDSKYNDKEVSDYIRLLKFREDRLEISNTIVEYINSNENISQEEFLNKIESLLIIFRDDEQEEIVIEEVEERVVEEETEESTLEETIEETEKTIVINEETNYDIESINEQLAKYDQKELERKNLEEKISNYEEFLNNHNLSNPEDKEMIERIKDKLQVAKEQYEQEKNKLFRIQENDEKMKYYSHMSKLIDKEIDNIDLDRQLKLLQAQKEGKVLINLGLKEEREIDSKKTELLKLKKELLQRKQNLYSFYDYDNINKLI